MCFLIMLLIDTWVIPFFLIIYSVLWVILLPNWSCFSQFCSSQQEYLLFHILANTCSGGWMRLSHLLLAPFIPRIHDRAGGNLLDKRHSLCGKASTVLRYCVGSQNSIINDSNHVKHGFQEQQQQKRQNLLKGRKGDWYKYSSIIFYYCHAVWHVGSLFPNQWSNPFPLHWEWRVLTSGPPRKSWQHHSKSMNRKRI